MPLIHINTALLSESLQSSATVCHRIPSQSFIPQGKWWSTCLTRCDGDQVCVRTAEGKDGERERERFCPTLSDSSLVWEHDKVQTVFSQCTLCVWMQHALHACFTFLFFKGVGVTKLVYHQLCSRSALVPAPVQYFFQLPSPNSCSGRFYCTTLGRLLWPDPEHLALCGLNVLRL